MSVRLLLMYCFESALSQEFDCFANQIFLRNFSALLTSILRRLIACLVLVALLILCLGAAAVLAEMTISIREVILPIPTICSLPRWDPSSSLVQFFLWLEPASSSAAVRSAQGGDLAFGSDILTLCLPCVCVAPK